MGTYLNLVQNKECEDPSSPPIRSTSWPKSSSILYSLNTKNKYNPLPNFFLIFFHLNTKKDTKFVKVFIIISLFFPHSHSFFTLNDTSFPQPTSCLPPPKKQEEKAHFVYLFIHSFQKKQRGNKT